MISAAATSPASGFSVTKAQGVSPHFVVGLGDDRGLHDLRMPVQHLLDLDRGNVLAAGDDDVLRAVLDLDIAVGVHDREVAGMEPAAGERLPGRFRVLQIALHDRVAAQQQFADRLSVGRHVAHRLGVGDALRVERQIRHALPRHQPGALAERQFSHSCCQAQTVEGP